MHAPIGKFRGQSAQETAASPVHRQPPWPCRLVPDLRLPSRHLAVSAVRSIRGYTPRISGREGTLDRRDPAFRGEYTQVFRWNGRCIHCAPDLDIFRGHAPGASRRATYHRHHPVKTIDVRPRNPFRSREMPLPEFTAENPESPISVGCFRETSCIACVWLLGLSPLSPPRHSRTLSCHTASLSLHALWVGRLQGFFPHRSLHRPRKMAYRRRGFGSKRIINEDEMRVLLAPVPNLLLQKRERTALTSS